MLVHWPGHAGRVCWVCPANPQETRRIGQKPAKKAIFGRVHYVPGAGAGRNFRGNYLYMICEHIGALAWPGRAGLGGISSEPVESGLKPVKMGPFWVLLGRYTMRRVRAPAETSAEVILICYLDIWGHWHSQAAGYTLRTRRIRPEFSQPVKKCPFWVLLGRYTMRRVRAPAETSAEIILICYLDIWGHWHSQAGWVWGVYFSEPVTTRQNPSAFFP